LAGDSGFIEESELGIVIKDMPKSERMLKVLIKSPENKPLTP